MNAEYKKFKEEGTILKGNVNMLTTIEYEGNRMRALSVKVADTKDTILIPVAELFLPKSGRSLKSLVGTDIDFRIKDVKKDVIYGERISILKDKKADLLKDVQADGEKVFTATIKKILEHGAYLTIGEVDVFMYNSAFAEGYIPVSAVKKIGDKVDVVFSKFNPKSEMIFMKMKDKYKEEIELDLKAVKPQDIMKGTIRTKTVNLCFVNVSPMIDVLCSPVEGLEVGDETLVKITGFKEENGRTRIRGKILVNRINDDLRL